MRRNILSIAVIAGCLLVAGVFSLPSAVAAKEVKLMPMELDGTEWTIELVISTAKDGTKKTQEDTLLFKGKKFNTIGQEKAGFGPSNYSLTVSDDDVTSFGTMQIMGEEKTAFWKGKVKGETVKGSVHVQYPSGKNNTQYYTGKLSSGTIARQGKPKPFVAPVVPPPPPPAPVVVEEEPVQQVIEEVTEAVVEEPQEAEDK